MGIIGKFQFEICSAPSCRDHWCESSKFNTQSNDTSYLAVAAPAGRGIPGSPIPSPAGSATARGRIKKEVAGTGAPDTQFGSFILRFAESALPGGAGA